MPRTVVTACMTGYRAGRLGDACIRSSQRVLALFWELQVPGAGSLEHV